MYWQQAIKWFISRAVIFYFLTAAIFLFFGDYKKACINRLNEITLWGDYPMLFDRGREPYDEQRLRMAVRYYKIVAGVFPQSDQPYSMIGYCYSVFKKNDLAKKYYQQAKIKSPGHFWHDYNLGELAYRQGEDDKALEYFYSVDSRDFESSVKEAILAPLSKVSFQQRQMFVDVVKIFVSELKSSSLKMIVKIYFKRRQYEQVIKIALLVMKDSDIQDRGVFVVYAAAAAYGHGDFGQSAALSKMVLEKEQDSNWGKVFLILSAHHLKQEVYQEDLGLFESFINDRELFPDSIEHVVFHPWAYSIQPGKEVYL